ncbi:short chain dehydrogenase [Streptomyces sp. NBC_01565]|uniref:short chain dehydrogenase n=1 Tax=unclassified Streptomyces TaxID=2593676 RepID=UPI00224F2617|nr:short chain dehydrogenase [Streptomyces sp. NBC_01565]MCX4545733.1 short chain dehydrogenase [Streptomyces sp. NBC_01565]
MRILLIGASGRLGAAVHDALTTRGHVVVTAGRSSGDLRYDVTDPAQIAALYDEAGQGGPLDAVASAAGSVPYKPVTEMTPEDWTAAFHGKVLSQLELVRQGVGRISPRGSFTLITGVLARSPIVTGAAASMANGAVEAFVRAAAVEIAPQRINAISPTVFTEALDVYGDFFPGFPPVDLADVARAYVRTIEGPETGRVLELGD